METHPYPGFTRAMKLVPVGHVAVLPATVVIIIYPLTTLVRAAMAMVAMVATLQYNRSTVCAWNRTNIKQHATVSNNVAVTSCQSYATSSACSL